MIKSKILNRFKNIEHGFFNSKGGFSKGIYKSLNCGVGSSDKKISVNRNLNLVLKNLIQKRKNLYYLTKFTVIKFFILKKK